MYQKFTNEKEALQLTELLKKDKIEYQLENHSPVPDIIFSTSELEKEFWIKLQKEDFKTADKIQADFLNALVENIDPEYYLFAFSTQELSEVINNPDEWSKLDFILAQKLLSAQRKQQNEKRY